MSEPDTDRPTEDQLLQEAAAWFARMRAPDAEASRDEFETWLARGALHRRAYNRAAEVFAMGKLLGDDYSAGTQAVARREPKRRALLGLAAVTLLVAAASWLTLRTWDMSGPEQSAGRAEVAHLSTITGERREVRLADGSVVKMEGGTNVAVVLSGATRRLTLIHGQARFEVAHEVRPFIVFAGGGSVTAHGTIFDVGLSADRRVSVRLIEGTVDVALPVARQAAAEKSIVRRLHRGEAISFMAERNVDARNRVTDQPGGDHKISVAAHEPARDYNEVRLADLIAAANVHGSRPIKLTDPTIGEQRISGRFRIDDTDLLAERIAGLFNLIIDRGDPGEISLRRK